FAGKCDREPFERKGTRGRKGDHLSTCVHAGVGASRRRDGDGIAQHRNERGFQRTTDGSHRRLPLEAAKGRAVVLDGGADRRYAGVSVRRGTLRFSSRSSRSAHVTMSVRLGSSELRSSTK